MNRTGLERLNSRQTQEEDYGRIRRLLLESQAGVPVGLNWDLRRLEGKRWYNSAPSGNLDWCKNSRLWETVDGMLVGWLHMDRGGYSFMELHPDYRFLEAEMIVWAEEHLAADDGCIRFFAYNYDLHRQRILTERGYRKTADGGVIYHLRFGQQPLPEPSVAEGYRLRATNPEDGRDAQQIADLLNAAFNRTFHTALEYQQFTRQATCFVPKLDLVAVAADGRLAAYVGVPYDQYNRRGIFEPVCTHPEHRQKGLARALMQEGLRRLRALGALDVKVETGDMIPANALYSGLGFTEQYWGYDWSLEKALVEDK